MKNATDNWRRMVDARTEQFVKATGLKARDWERGTKSYPRRLQSVVRQGRPSGLLMNALHSNVEPDSTVIDVGPGPGRYTIPLASMCKQVFAVEPSDEMATYLLANLEADGISNVTVVRSTWQDADVPTCDFVLTSHVLYEVSDIAGFIRKMRDKAARAFFIVHHRDQFDMLGMRLWPLVHGDKLAPVPVLSDLIDVISELGIRHGQVSLMPPISRISFANLDEAMEYCTERLGLAPDSPARATVAQQLPKILEKKDERWLIPNQGPSGVVWCPTS